MVAPTIELNNGNFMPALGLGTMMSNGPIGVQAVKDAIDAGYRLFDTAYVYRNEVDVGQGICEKIDEGVIKREDVFVVTKLWSTFHDKIEAACRASLQNLGLEYIDLYLMHTPFGYSEKSNGPESQSEFNYVHTWHGMEALTRMGLVKNIGISNFNANQIKRLVTHAFMKPVNLQIECNPNINQLDLIELCKKHNIIVSAYAPLGQPDPYLKSPDFLFDSRIDAIGRKYGKTNAQVALRYLVERGVVPIPKSSNKKRIIENISIFDFQLTRADMNLIDTFNINKRICKFEHAINHMDYPF